MANINRPVTDPLGRTIKYADSPRTGFYDVDHSDPTKWDQVTGVPTDTFVSVGVTRITPSQTYTPTLSHQDRAYVKAAATGGMDEPQTMAVQAGTTVGSARLVYARNYGTPDGSEPYIGGQRVSDSTILSAGDILLMKIPMKSRG